MQAHEDAAVLRRIAQAGLGLLQHPIGALSLAIAVKREQCGLLGFELVTTSNGAAEFWQLLTVRNPLLFRPTFVPVNSWV